MIDITGLNEEQIESVRAYAHAIRNNSVRNIEHQSITEWYEKTGHCFYVNECYRIFRPDPAKYRPWTHTEAVGKAIRFKAFDQSFLITHTNEDVFEFAGYTRSPREVLLYCEQINGEPCGELMNDE